MTQIRILGTEIQLCILKMEETAKFGFSPDDRGIRYINKEFVGD